MLTIQVPNNLTKKKLILNCQRALKKAGLITELMLFTDYSSFAGPCKKGGRDDVREVAAMFLKLEPLVIQPKKKKKKKAKKARK